MRVFLKVESSFTTLILDKTVLPTVNGFSIRQREGEHLILSLTLLFVNSFTQKAPSEYSVLHTSGIALGNEYTGMNKTVCSLEELTVLWDRHTEMDM